MFKKYLKPLSLRNRRANGQANCVGIEALQGCNYLRKLNEVLKFNAYPMPEVDKLIEVITALYIPTLFIPPQELLANTF